MTLAELHRGHQICEMAYSLMWIASGLVTTHEMIGKEAQTGRFLE